MENSSELEALKTSLKNNDIGKISELLECQTSFITNEAGNIINLLGMELTKFNFLKKRNYFDFCELQLLNLAKNIKFQDNIFDFLELVESNNCRLLSSVSAAVAIINTMENPEHIYIEYLLIGTFNHLNELDVNCLQTNFLPTIQILTKLDEQIQKELSTLFYFTKLSYLVLQIDINPLEYLNIISDIIFDPFYLLEYEFEQSEDEDQEIKFIASFFYLYFKTGKLWNPKIYNRFYILQKISYLALSVFDDDDFGKSFTKLILMKYKDNEIPLYMLNKWHEKFFMEAAHNSLYNESLSTRRDSFEILMIFFDKLNEEAQYNVFRKTFSKLTDSGLKAELIIKIKQIIFSRIKNQKNLVYFSGILLLKIVQQCCEITDGNECNVVENKEHVLAAITLVYVLYGYNGDGFKFDELFTNFAKNFASLVQSAINYTTEQYKLESMKLNSSKIINDNNSLVQIQNIDLPKLTLSEKQDMLSQYNTTLKLIQSNLDLFKSIIQNRG
ncbi:uncharacterized protein LOC126901794 isoform X1 [Daktulosphaira vitifoliae]|uniref:uncharacterized protein LOC126901794 isoform X1 n=1 Tax=Daktulosphaira vitifoliae TaxID=58002 RepID=UPI0021AA8274|nr:uncharacterized protein LOC126901794 isoform X1 [Daktulosphaira vitifoliae]